MQGLGHQPYFIGIQSQMIFDTVGIHENRRSDPERSVCKAGEHCRKRAWATTTRFHGGTPGDCFRVFSLGLGLKFNHQQKAQSPPPNHESALLQ